LAVTKTSYIALTLTSFRSESIFHFFVCLILLITFYSELVAYCRPILNMIVVPNVHRVLVLSFFAFGLHATNFLESSNVYRLID